MLYHEKCNILGLVKLIKKDSLSSFLDIINKTIDQGVHLEVLVLVVMSAADNKLYTFRA